jgi:hypothetical protein
VPSAWSPTLESARKRNVSAECGVPNTRKRNVSAECGVPNTDVRNVNLCCLCSAKLDQVKCSEYEVPNKTIKITGGLQSKAVERVAGPSAAHGRPRECAGQHREAPDRAVKMVPGEGGGGEGADSLLLV